MRRTDWLGLRLGMLWALRATGLPVRAAHRLLLGRRIGPGFRIGRRSCVLGRSVSIGRDVRIGARTNVVADEIVIEDGVTIGADVTIRCKRLVLRRGCRIDHQNTIYGIATARSALEVGEFAWIFSHCHLNTDDRIAIGARTAVGFHCQMYTHSSFMPVTQGYPVTVAPIEIAEDVWLPVHVFILPGARIERGATLGAFSLVGGRIPEYCLAVGVPARVIKDAQSYRRRYSPEEMASLCERITSDVLASVAHAFRPATIFFPGSRTLESTGPGCWTLREGASSGRVVLLPAAGDRAAGWLREPGDTLFLTAGADGPPVPGCNWCDLVSQRSSLPRPLPPIVSEVLPAFSRYGIRFAWHAGAGGPPASPAGGNPSLQDA